MSDYPRESKEFIAIAAGADDVTLTSADAAHVAYCITAPENERPVTWVTVEVLETEIGFFIGPGTINDYSGPGRQGDRRVWCKDTDNPEAPVVDCDTFRIT